MNKGATNLYTIELLAVRSLNGDCIEITCTRPESFQFKAGQHVTLILDDLAREYTIVSAENSETLKFLVKILPQGQMSNRLSALPVGGRLAMEEPRGYLIKKRADEKAVFIAHGAGIAPFVSMAKSGTRASYIIHGAADASGLFYRDILCRAADFYVPCLSRDVQAGLTGDIHRGYVTSFLAGRLPPAKYSFYLCGSWAMIRDAVHIIDERFPDSTVQSEGFY